MASVVASVSSYFHGENLFSSYSSLFSRATLTFSRPISDNDFNGSKRFMVLAKRLSGLEEAMRIRREREQNPSKPIKRRTPLRRLKVS
ncbi:hypothetical protein L1887_38177 [Cichorium endivia]|nr:hypothetical protein L1887_38177 [Cichorium endivia]